ncbi:L-ascorbate peroxidase [Salix suchowensis]|nr:L-ascorbate peroxidase [Salix suchowensis]
MALYSSNLTLSPPKSQSMASLRASSSLCLSSSSSYSPSSLKCLQFSPLAPHIFKDQKRSSVSTAAAASDPAQLKSAREDIKELLKSKSCHPILVRLGWHDSGTYNKNIEEWPRRGGANGSLRFDIELKHAANAGLVNALNLIKPIKDKYSGVTFADLFQLASATAIEVTVALSWWPEIPMKYGRVDVSAPADCPEEGGFLLILKSSLVYSCWPPKPADHLREVFYRMGLNDREIVALSGAHTLGRSRPERSGWGKPETKYTKNGPGAPGGQSWTAKWLKFDNSYFKDIKERKDDDLLVLPTDAALLKTLHSSFPLTAGYAEKYAEDQEAFFKDYAEAHAKLSNLGQNLILKRFVSEGIVLDDVAGEKFTAANYSSGKD